MWKIQYTVMQMIVGVKFLSVTTLTIALLNPLCENELFTLRMTHALPCRLVMLAQQKPAAATIWLR